MKAFVKKNYRLIKTSICRMDDIRLTGKKAIEVGIDQVTLRRIVVYE
ncbi:MAG: hypothetical protein M9959_13095 [Chitinophagaceae bacterium]|nr:hypothetical protein [Chitinophagaceae bacterium]